MSAEGCTASVVGKGGVGIELGKCIQWVYCHPSDTLKSQFIQPIDYGFHILMLPFVKK